MPAKGKDPKVSQKVVAVEEDLEAQILDLNDGEIDEYKMDDETVKEQKLLKLNDFINDCKKDVKDSALVEIYFFSDKVLKYENFLSGSNYAYLQPVFVKISNNDRKGLKAIGLTKLQ